MGIVYNFLFFLPCANAQMRLIGRQFSSVCNTALLKLAFFDVSPDSGEYIEENNGGDIIYTTAVNPPHLQILRIDRELREEIIDHVIMHST